MSNDVVAFKSWLDAYGRAWESRNPEAASAAVRGKRHLPSHAISRTHMWKKSYFRLLVRGGPN
jgi:hypothetical protein